MNIPRTRVWLAKVGFDGEDEVLIGVYEDKDKAIKAALTEAPKEGSPYVEDPASNDIYVRYTGEGDHYVVADSWEVL